MNNRVLVREEGGVAVVTLNRADKHNGFDFEMMEGLLATARRLRRTRGLRAVVIHGDGPSFCAGLDFGSVMKRVPSIVRHFCTPFWRSTNGFQEVVWLWRRLRVPVIAAVHGNCFGAGVQIALAADFRIATADSKWSVMEIKWGLIPDMAGTVLLNEVLRLDVAKELTMTGRVIDGLEARELGLVTRVAADPLASAMELARELSLRSPDALCAAKALLSRNRRGSLWMAFLRERLYQLKMFAGGNQRIAMRAAMKKEVPKFK